MNYKECLEYIHGISWLGSKPGLSRIKVLTSLMGNPQDSLGFIHVAGTNGKGSVCAMMTEILIAAGFTVGTFTSPYVYRFNERMAVNGKEIDDDTLADIVEYVMPFAESMEDRPTEFELITAVGFEYFKRSGCDIVVLEAGMGGRLDSTNIIEKSRLSIITGVDLDHTAYLGDTVEKIAKEKAGIIKCGCPVLAGNCPESAKEVIKNEAWTTGAPYYEVDFGKLTKRESSLSGNKFIFDGTPYETPLCGTYQPCNAAIAITAALVLGIDEKTVKKGLSNVRWRARFEVISTEPTVIFDGGHNPQGVRAAVDSVKEMHSSKVNILTGVMADKDHASIVRMISEIADKVYCVTPDNPRALDAAKYSEEFSSVGLVSKSFKSIDEAVRTAVSDSLNRGVPLLCLGSLYMYHDVLDAINQYKIK